MAPDPIHHCSKRQKTFPSPSSSLSPSFPLSAPSLPPFSLPHPSHLCLPLLFLPLPSSSSSSLNAPPLLPPYTPFFISLSLLPLFLLLFVRSASSPSPLLPFFLFLPFLPSSTFPLPFPSSYPLSALKIYVAICLVLYCNISTRFQHTNQ